MNIKWKIGVLLPLIFFVKSYALDFAIKPIRIYVNLPKTTAVFQIQSLTDKTITIETEVKYWQMNRDGSFKLEDTEDLVVVPPFIKLAPRQKQLIKIAYLGEHNLNKQGTYRLILKQLPQELDLSKKPDKIKTAVQIVLHISVPIFVNPPGVPLGYNLSFEPEEVSKKEVKIIVKNNGNAFGRIIKAILYKGNEEIFSRDYALYVLPGDEIEFVIKPPKDKKTLEEKEFPDIPDKVKIITEDEKEIIVNL
ncbi:fimbrial biogenesis chaperone [Persephonella sp.]